MLYFNISDYINQTHKMVLLSGSYLPPICCLPSGHAEDIISKRKKEQTDEMIENFQLKLVIASRAPPN